VSIQRRILDFVTRSNWFLFIFGSLLALINLPLHFALGIICGGVIVTVNFYLLSRTLKKALTPPRLASPRIVIAKYYIRFMISAFIIYLLISRHIVDPMGLLLGLSIVVISIMLATFCEITKHIFFKEAV
jgi:hypothetical protein